MSRLERALKDEDPYVRKTAAVCVAKLHDISPDLVKDRGFLDLLRDLVADANPTVVANAVAALSEIADDDKGSDDVMGMSSAKLQKLLAALNECTEWGQVSILDALAKYVPRGGQGRGADHRARHAAAAAREFVLWCCPRSRSSCSTCTRLWIRSRSCACGYRKKLSPPLVTMVGCGVLAPSRVSMVNVARPSHRGRASSPTRPVAHRSKRAGQHRRALSRSEREFDHAERSAHPRK